MERNQAMTPRSTAWLIGVLWEEHHLLTQLAIQLSTCKTEAACKCKLCDLMLVAEVARCILAVCSKVLTTQPKEALANQVSMHRACDSTLRLQWRWTDLALVLWWPRGMLWQGLARIAVEIYVNCQSFPISLSFWVELVGAYNPIW
jgi:hypothetical protein